MLSVCTRAWHDIMKDVSQAELGGVGALHLIGIKYLGILETGTCFATGSSRLAHTGGCLPQCVAVADSQPGAAGWQRRGHCWDLSKALPGKGLWKQLGHALSSHTLRTTHLRHNFCVALVQALALPSVMSLCWALPL